MVGVGRGEVRAAAHWERARGLRAYHQVVAHNGVGAHGCGAARWCGGRGHVHSISGTCKAGAAPHPPHTQDPPPGSHLPSATILSNSSPPVMSSRTMKIWGAGGGGARGGGQGTRITPAFPGAPWRPLDAHPSLPHTPPYKHLPVMQQVHHRTWGGMPAAAPRLGWGGCGITHEEMRQRFRLGTCVATRHHVPTSHLAL